MVLMAMATCGALVDLSKNPAEGLVLLLTESA